MSTKRKKKSIPLVAIISIFVFVAIGSKLLIKTDKSQTVADIETQNVSMPYINPAWEEYMKLTEEEKSQVSIIPEKYIYNYIPEDNLYDNYDELPSKFNLRDIAPTIVKDQGQQSLCWAYAMTSTIESNLKLRKNIDANFSPQHISAVCSGYNTPTYIYMTYGEGIPFANELGFHNSILSSGFIPVSVDKYKGKISSKDTDYFIKNTVAFPLYENTIDYRNMIKSYIKNYGAICVGTVGPSTLCGSYYNEEYNMIEVHYLNRENPETGIPEGAEYRGHMMIIIGWDDEYGPDNDGDGKPDGAWILQNSWEDKSKMFPYLSFNSEIDVLTGIKIVEEREWDNNYSMASYPLVETSGEEIEQEKSFFKDTDYRFDAERENPLLNVTAINGSVEVTYFKSNYKESLKNVNFSTASQNSTYQVYVSADGNKNNYTLVKEIKTDMPGIYTIDCDDILLDSDKFSIKVSTNSGALYTQINAFTNDVEAKTSSYAYIYEGQYNKKKNQYIYHLNFHDDGTDRNYKLYLTDTQGNLVSGTYQYQEIYEFNEGFIADLSFPKNLKYGEDYILEICDGSRENLISKLSFTYSPQKRFDTEGQGIEENPFIIKKVEDFKTIYDIPNAYYRLNNDIDFSTNSDFLKDIEINFEGFLDGNGYSLMNYSGEKTLFDKIENSKINNISIKNFNVLNSSGLLSS